MNFRWPMGTARGEKETRNRCLHKGGYWRHCLGALISKRGRKYSSRKQPLSEVESYLNTHVWCRRVPNRTHKKCWTVILRRKYDIRSHDRARGWSQSVCPTMHLEMEDPNPVLSIVSVAVDGVAISSGLKECALGIALLLPCIRRKNDRTKAIEFSILVAFPFIDRGASIEGKGGRCYISHVAA